MASIPDGPQNWSCFVIGPEMGMMAMFGWVDCPNSWDGWDEWDDWGCGGGEPDLIQAAISGMKDWAKDGSIAQIPFNILWRDSTC